MGGIWRRLWMPLLLGSVLVAATEGCWADIPVAAGLAVMPVGVWQSLSEKILARAQSLALHVQTGPGPGPVRLLVPVSEVFVGNGREVQPAFERFLADVGLLIRNEPGLRVQILGFGNIPAQTYNPVELGLRLRRLRSTLATYGVPIPQMKAALRPESEYAGPRHLMPLVSRGGLIELEFGPG
jgi:hypothetical protein